MVQPLALVQDRHPEQAPAAAVRGGGGGARGGLLSVLALQAHGEEIHPIHRALIDANAEIAFARWEDRAHDLLRLDHIFEQAEIVDFPGEFPGEDVGGGAEGGDDGGLGIAVAVAVAGEGDGFVEDEDVSGDDEGGVVEEESGLRVEDSR